jgi:hypothetical protein
LKNIWIERSKLKNQVYKIEFEIIGVLKKCSINVLKNNYFNIDSIDPIFCEYINNRARFGPTLYDAVILISVSDLQQSKFVILDAFTLIDINTISFGTHVNSQTGIETGYLTLLCSNFNSLKSVFFERKI